MHPTLIEIETGESMSMLTGHTDLRQKGDLIAVGCHTASPGDVEQGQEEQTGNVM